jgi:hypothetical protein
MSRSRIFLLHIQKDCQLIVKYMQEGFLWLIDRPTNERLYAIKVVAISNGNWKLGRVSLNPLSSRKLV